VAIAKPRKVLGVVYADAGAPRMFTSWKMRAGPSGLHLFDRRTGANVLLDEVEIPPQSWATAPRQVSISLTNTCDLSCRFCFAPKHRAELPFDKLTAWLTELDSEGCLGVGFGGGEPTKYPRFVELCRFTTSATRLAVTFTTHGHSFDVPLADALRESVHFVRVSMDGVGTTYESLRSRSFLDLVKRLELVRSVAPFGINYVVNAQTLPCLDSAAALAADSGATEILLLPERGKGPNAAKDSVSEAGLRRWIDGYRGAVALSVSELDSDGLPTCSPFVGESGLAAYAHVDAEGVLRRTSFERDGVSIGDGGILQALGKLKEGWEGDKR